MGRGRGLGGVLKLSLIHTPLTCPTPRQVAHQCAALNSTRTAPTRRWVRGKRPCHPFPPCSSWDPHPMAGVRGGSPDPDNCGPQTPCCGRTRASAPTPAPPRATPRSSPWCGCPAGLLPATWPGNTTAVKRTSREPTELGQETRDLGGAGALLRLRACTRVGHQFACHHGAPGLWTSCLTFLPLRLLQKRAVPPLSGLFRGVRGQRTFACFLPATDAR